MTRTGVDQTMPAANDDTHVVVNLLQDPGLGDKLSTHVGVFRITVICFAKDKSLCRALISPGHKLRKVAVDAEPALFTRPR